MKGWRFFALVAVVAVFCVMGFAACGDEETTYTVTFDSNGGTAVTAQTVASGGKATEPQSVINRDLTLDGWYKENTLTNKWNFATDTVASSITLYAKWKGNGTTIFAIGETGPGGGKVFYYSGDGFTVYQNVGDTTGVTCHYLEAAPANMATIGLGLAWASTGKENTDIGGTAVAIGTGKKNTALILVTDADAPAAKACNEYSNGGKTDWFLPSKDELAELYKNRAAVNIPSSNSYLSSSQYSNIYAWRMGFHDGGQSGWDKDSLYSVRAIRAF